MKVINIPNMIILSLCAWRLQLVFCRELFFRNFVFSIYKNNVINSSNKFYFLMYADNTTLYLNES